MPIEQHPIQSREEWLARRRQDVTASDIGALAGVDEYRTPLGIFAEKTGMVAGATETNLMRRGRWLEPAVLAAVREARPDWEAKPARVYLRDPEIRLGATPDSFVVDPGRPGVGNLQLKVVSRPTFEVEWADGGVPLKYTLQTLAEALLAECEWAAIAALIVDTHSADVVIRDVPRHAGAEDRIRELAQNFWRGVAQGMAPPANFERDLDLIKKLHPRGGGASVDLTGDERATELCEQKLRWTQRRRNAEGALDTIDAELCDLLGDADRGEHPDFNVTWKLQSRAETILPATEFRALRVTRKGKKEKPTEAA